MRSRTVDFLCWCFLGLLALGLILALNPTAWADKDRSQWANSPNKSWYDRAETTQAARARLGFKSCCEKADVVKTRFRVEKDTGTDEWFYDNNGTWKHIPSDIIHWGESGPNGEAVLFKVGTTEACFWPPEGGI